MGVPTTTKLTCDNTAKMTDETESDGWFGALAHLLEFQLLSCLSFNCCPAANCLQPELLSRALVTLLLQAVQYQMCLLSFWQPGPSVLQLALDSPTTGRAVASTLRSAACCAYATEISCSHPFNCASACVAASSTEPAAPPDVVVQPAIPGSQV